ncbi:phage tail tape measure protein [bacterium 210820-DFI.6.37]|nr:phage tail tape measure protein [bacterium 210820-DFI.6.37]
MSRGKEMIAVVGISGVLDKSLNQAVDAAQKKISGINPKALKAAAAVGTIAGAAFKAGKELANIGGEYQRSMNQLQASTGATGKEIKALGDTVKAIYANNFGESIQDVSDSVAEVVKATDLSGESLQKVTEGAITLRDTFGYDVAESARAAKAMMINFGIDGEEALSMIAAGAQNGLDFSGELMDSISEYSVQFAKVGLDANDMFNIFQQGADSGAWNLDKVGDAVKEFSIRAIDGSNTTTEAYKALGLDAEKMMQTFAKGGPEANKAFDMVLNKLMDMDDKVARDAAGVALFGTQWEDLGTEAMQALANTENKAYDTNNALKGVEEIKYNDLQSAMEGIWRVLEVALLPAASALANKLTELKPTIESVINFAVEHMNIILPVIGALGAALGALKFAKLTSEIGGYAKAIKGATGAAKLFLTTKLKDKAETAALRAMYAKDAVVRKANAAATKAQALATKLFSKEKLKERAEVAKATAANAKDKVTKLTNAAATKAQALATKLFFKEKMKERAEVAKTTAINEKDKVVKLAGAAATKTWAAVSKGAALAAKGLGLAVRFMTGPIGIAITVITAIIAAGVLLYKNWDTVKAKAIAFGSKIKSVFVNIKNAVVGAFKTMRSKIAGIFSSLAGIVKTPLNAVISIVNKAIDKVNQIHFEVPDWIPKVGGKSFGVNVPKIPLLATGGVTDGPSIAGEGAYNEYVITPDPRYRTQNLAYWQQAGKALGAEDSSYTLGGSASVNINMGGVEYNPNIEINGNASREDVLAALRKDREEFMDMLEEWWAERMEYAYDQY